MLYGEEIINQKSDFYLDVYEPKEMLVILGRSRTIEGDIYEEKCKEDNINILKRISGGGTVLLAPGMFIWQLLISTSTQLMNQKKWFSILSKWILQILEDYGVNNAEIKGTSDITINNRKISGTSLFIGKNRIIYHGTLLLDIDTKLFDKYLKYPDIVPDYRNGRIHSDFVTTLKEQNISIERDRLLNLFFKNPYPTEKDYIS